LGADKTEYESNTHAALRDIEMQNKSEVADNLTRSKAMKAELQKTSFIIGDEENK
jgi:hypothetical protein